MTFDFITNILKYIITYFVPIVTLVISIVSLIFSIRVPKIDKKIKEYDLTIKKYINEEIEKSSKKEAIIEAKIIKISDGNYRIRVYNKGNATAYNVDYSIPEKYNIITINEVTPYEELKPKDSFDELVIISMQSLSKYEIILEWYDQVNNHYKNKCYGTW